MISEGSFPFPLFSFHKDNSKTITCFNHVPPTPSLLSPFTLLSSLLRSLSFSSHLAAVSPSTRQLLRRIPSDVWSEHLSMASGAHLHSLIFHHFPKSGIRHSQCVNVRASSEVDLAATSGREHEDPWRFCHPSFMRKWQRSFKRFPPSRGMETKNELAAYYSPNKHPFS